MELPRRDAGLRELGCFSLLAGTKGCVDVSGLVVYMAGSKSRWDILDQCL